MHVRLLIFAVACYGLVATAAQASCGTASCSVNTGTESLGTGHEKNWPLIYAMNSSSKTSSVQAATR
ncbi:MAG: hypothetical protein O2845_04850 [Proteobacteria bacterium]|nr:hypothetical protein [Pseudomonadota bacterium]